ncbi:MAG: prolipoprotein diacylglyceryl transferase [Pseudomonadota bacterium]|nr:prolipoprotein diacylglyceryl transferase [Pseudomonadota bacterium]
MHPTLCSILGLDVPSYAVLVSIGIVLAAWVRRREVARLGYDRTPGHPFIGFAALLGGLFGSKLGMVLFVPPDELMRLGLAALDFDFTGKTVVGGIAGGYLGVELAKKVVGVRHSTGDAFAVALPLAQGVGRIGCFLHGCCVGAETHGPLGIVIAGVPRHPAQLYETVLDFALAAGIWSIRARPRPAGHLFKLTLVGYATIRFALEPRRGDTGWMVGPLTAVQVVCALAIVGFGGVLVRGRGSVSGAGTSPQGGEAAGAPTPAPVATE